jgi:hypothetical protein
MSLPRVSGRLSGPLVTHYSQTRTQPTVNTEDTCLNTVVLLVISDNQQSPIAVSSQSYSLCWVLMHFTLSWGRFFNLDYPLICLQPFPLRHSLQSVQKLQNHLHSGLSQIDLGDAFASPSKIL